MLALIVFAVTAWFVGLRPGGIAGGISLATLIAAQVVPGTALLVYGIHIVYIGGLVWLGPKLSRLRRPQERPGLTGDLGRWFRRGKAIWKARRSG